MLSNGGIGSAKLAAEMPVRLGRSPGRSRARSSPSGSAQLLGVPEILAYDMGGTTAKVCLIREGALPLTDELEVARSRRFTKSSGFPVAIPAVNMIEIGAGGGSIARINALGIVEVGPAQRRRRSGACVLWPGRRQADRVGRGSGARLSHSGQLRRRHNAARPVGRRARYHDGDRDFSDA